jgi:cytochrome c oxidase subunit 1
MYLLYAMRWGPRAGANPWGSRSFEWRTPSPPPPHNFDQAPSVAPDAYDYTEPLRDAEEVHG